MDGGQHEARYRIGTQRETAMAETTRQALEREVRELRDEIDRVQDLDVIATISEDGTRVTEVDPQDALPGIIIQLEDAEERLQRQVAKDAYLRASGG
jgi:hypothetical protein